MKRFMLFFILISLMLTIFSANASAQNLQQFFNKIKVGEWLEVEGQIQKDNSVLVEEIEVVRGEMEANDFEISGVINSVDAKEKFIYILNLKAKLDENTEYDDDLNLIKAFSDIKTGAIVELEGSFLKEGYFLVEEIKSIDPLDLNKNEIEMTGRIDAVNPVDQSISMLGQTIFLNEKTKFKSFIY